MRRWDTRACVCLPVMMKVTPLPHPPPSQVSKVVMKVKQLVNVANISSSLASTVVTIISNVLSSSETALAPTSETYVPLCSVLVLLGVADAPLFFRSSSEL